MISEIYRKPKGPSTIVEVELDKRQQFCSNISLAAKRQGGKVEATYINGFDFKNNPVYMVKVEVIEECREPAKRGPKGKQNAKRN